MALSVNRAATPRSSRTASGPNDTPGGTPDVSGSHRLVTRCVFVDLGFENTCEGAQSDRRPRTMWNRVHALQGNVSARRTVRRDAPSSFSARR